MRLQLGWNRKWSLCGATSSILSSLVLVAALVALIYLALAHGGSPQRQFIRSGAVDRYYLVSGALYLAFRMALPTAALAAQRAKCPCAGCATSAKAGSRLSRFALPECSANLHAVRCLLSSVVFYLTLLLSLAEEFPGRWRGVLATHLYTHLLADVLLLLPVQILSAAVTCCCGCCCRPQGTSVLSCLHPGDAFLSHGATAQANVDFLVFICCSSLSPVLSVIFLARTFLLYLVFLISALACKSDGEVFSGANVKFLVRNSLPIHRVNFVIRT